MRNSFAVLLLEDQPPCKTKTPSPPLLSSWGQEQRQLMLETPGPRKSQQRRSETRSRDHLGFGLHLTLQLRNACCLMHPQDSTRKCGAGPGQGTGTSGHRAHLAKEHCSEWNYILTMGKVKTSVQMIADALTAKVDMSTPPIGAKEKEELHRLTALWISKCGRPQAVVEDTELRSLLARILELCKARLRYELPCRQTIGKHLMLLGHEGKALGRDFIVRLIKSGVRPTITGDLWSESGMGLFGIYAHGITETWVVEKALIGLVACSAERHTAVNIKKWTEEALVSIGFRSEDLLGSS
ncbi:hypothetical protein AB1Y20_020013 [Prymnesium parvum]|uniref:Uncharacterized protein n=1 Tax=Prymnesium parvum TaxID=97485 RepID=A0AB34JVP2_PRYPA